MLCRQLRNLVFGRLALAAAVCLALFVSGGPGTPTLPGERQAPSLVLRTIEFPLAVLALGGAVRLEKQAQTPRFVLHRPNRISRLSPAECARPFAVRPELRHTLRVLPRRGLPARRLMPRAPSDAGDPFLTSSLIS